jgi:FkbM family methyltransferase
MAKLQHALERFPYDTDESAFVGNMDLAKSIEQITRAIGDNCSLDLFNARLAFSVTRNYSVMQKFFDMHVPNYAYRLFPHIPNYIENKDVYIFGGGVLAWHTVNLLPQLSYRGIIDNHIGQSGDSILGLPILKLDEFLNKNKSTDYYIGIAMTNSEHRKQVEQQLRKAGINYEKTCFDLAPIMSEVNKICEEQYFNLPALTHDENEVFVDCGVWDGASSAEFLKWSKGRYKHILAFEPDKRQHALINVKMRNAHNFDLIDCALSNVNETTHYYKNIPSSFSIAGGKGESAKEQVRCVKFDDFLTNEKVTFIKMDIEGAEYAALSGMQNTIRTHKPKLAICVYHRPEDIITIPSLILSLNNEYKLFFRHPYKGTSQTVMFAV